MPNPPLPCIGPGRVPLRIAGLYAMVGLLWIWLSDGVLYWLEYSDGHAFLVSAAKGTAFVSVTTVLLYWLVRREVASVQRSEILLRAVVEGTSDAVFVKDRVGRYLLFNEAAAAFVGKPVAEVLGRDDTVLFEAADAQQIIADDRRIMASGRVITSDEVLTSAGTKRTYHATKAPFRDVTGEIAGLIGISRDITDRKATEDALRDSEKRYRELANAIPQIVWMAVPDGAVVHVNSKAVEYTGLEVAELAGWSWQRAIHSDDRDHALREWSLAVADGVPRTYEVRIRRADGEYRWHIVRQLPIFNAAGVIESWVGTCTDIDDLSRTENALRETETRLREAQRIARMGSWNWEPSTDKVWWSDAEFELFGVDRKEIHPSFEAFLGLLHPDDRVIAIARVEAMIAGADEFANDMRVIRPDGSSMWIHSRARATRDADGKIIRVEGTDQDITARRLAELAAQQSEKQLQVAIEVAGLGVIVINYASQTAVLSPRAAEQFGFLPGTAVSRTALHLRFHPDDRAEVEWLTENALDPAGTGWFAIEHRVVWPDGSTRWLYVRKQVSFVDGRPDHAVVVALDVTHRRLAEEALRASESRYRLMFEANPHPMWVYDIETFRFLAVNDSAVHAYGYSREEFLAMSIRDIRPAEDVERLESTVARTTRGLSHSSFCRHRRKDGTVFYVDVSSHDLPDAGGRSRLVMALDVTDRLQAEESRDELLTRLQMHIDLMPFAYVCFDSDFCYSNWNPAAEKIFGYSREEILGQPFQFLVHPDDRAEVAVFVERLRSGDMQASGVNRNVTKDGRVIVCEWHNTPLSGPGGAFLGVLSMTLEITDRVRAEQELRESERRLRLALEAAGAIAFRWDIRNDAVTRYFSTEPALPVTAERLGTLDDVRARIHPDDLSAFDTRLSACLTEGSEYRSSYRVVRPDATSATLEEYGYLDRSADGSPLFLNGISIDISDRVAATEALQESEMRYRRLVAVLPTALLVHNGERVLYSNPAFVRLVGAESADEVLYRRPIDFVAPEHRSLVLAQIEEMSQTGEPASGAEIRMLRIDGRSVPTYSVSTPVTGYGSHAFLFALSDLTERERATQLLRSVLSSVSDAILTIDERGIIGSANPAALWQFGYDEEELLGGNVGLLMPEPYRDELDAYLASDGIRMGAANLVGLGREVECLRRDGSRFRAELTVTEFSLDGERHFTGVLRDITERQRLQTQFIEAQKMEAIGRLAGGVAHDFNNLLTIINGYCDLLLTSDLQAGDRRRESISPIRDAGERAARLTQQLLAFSRKAVIEPKVIDLNELVSDSAKLLRRLIGEDIILAVITSPKRLPAKVDPGQLEQVIMNLFVNARDAMPTGGRLTIETSTAATEDGLPSRFARLSVSDTGHGMPDEVKEKIFEPFFTTKGVGKGTGLGLAVVHGVISQSGGQISIESSVGVGTTFHILLPLIVDSPSAPATNAVSIVARGAETVLLVEDDEAVRKIARISLQTQGYTVLEADGGAAAIRQAERHHGEIHLLVSDVVMPEMGGRQLLDAVRQFRPGLRVLFMSGYTDDAVLLHGVVEATDAFIQKPFTPLSLARKVREVIDAPVR